MVDGGYDVADYRDVDPMFGTLADFDAMIADAHALGLRVIVDIVPNHTSAQHAWFQAALAAGARLAGARPVHLPPTATAPTASCRRTTGSRIFGGPAWTRIADGQWYLHLFDPAQPDLNWDNPEVRAEFEDVLRFWLDRGVDGFRDRRRARHGQGGRAAGRRSHDAASRSALLGTGPAAVLRPGRRARDLPRLAADPGLLPRRPDGGRRGVGVDARSGWPATSRPDELHQAFNFDFLDAPWSADCVARGRSTPRWPRRQSSARRPPGCCPTTTSPRHVTRYGDGATACAGPAPPPC